MDQISLIKQKLDIVDIVGGYVSIKKSGRNYKGLCPFHSEKTPSFMVSPELQIYKCFGCGASGDIFGFVKQVEGIEFTQALEILAERAGVKLERTDLDPNSHLKKQIFYINDVTAKFYSFLLTKHPAGKYALDYLLTTRKLTLETINEFCLGFAPDNWSTLYDFLVKKGFNPADLAQAGVIIPKQSGQGYIDKFRDRITFPLSGVDGKIVGFTARTISNKEPKYLNTGETLVFHKTHFLFGLDKNKVTIKKEGAVFVEGQMDLISAYQAGIRNLVSVSGTSLTENQLMLLARYTSDLTFCFDGDGAGIAASYRAIELAEKLNFNTKVALIPQAYKDLDDICKANADEAKRILTNSLPVYDYVLVTTLKKYDKTQALGKKNIMEALLPVFSKISNQVMLDHYTKKIAEELGLSEEAITSTLKQGVVSDREFHVPDTQDSPVFNYKQDPEGYLLALLLKSDLETAQEFLPKIKQEFIENANLRLLFDQFAETTEGRKRSVNINSFIEKLDEAIRGVASDLYLWDLESLLNFEDKEALHKEIDTAIKRINLIYTKKLLKELSDQIKLAEMEKDTEKVDKLSKKFERLSKGLL
jgi:DNA primase